MLMETRMARELPILFSGAMVRAILSGRKTQTRRVVKLQPPDDYPFALCDADGRVSWMDVLDENYCECWPEDDTLVCPYGKPGDKLWVRETWRPVGTDEDGSVDIQYRADGEINNIFVPDEEQEVYDKISESLEPYVISATETAGARIDDTRVPWRPSIFLPRWAYRIKLEVVKVRAERLQDIREEDIKAEGITWDYDPRLTLGKEETLADEDREKMYRVSFKNLWDKINGKPRKNKKGVLGKSYPWESNPWVWVVEFKILEGV